MIAENSSSEALTAQADIHRFYIEIITPALAKFVPENEPGGGATTDMDLFLQRARINTHNALCYEMRRTFALVLGALFERHLRLWLSRMCPGRNVARRKWPGLTELIDEVDGCFAAKDGPITALTELWFVANAVRHGEGRSVEKLLNDFPQLWNRSIRTPGDNSLSDPIGGLRIGDLDLERYSKAMLDFWRLAGASAF